MKNKKKIILGIVVLLAVMFLSITGYKLLNKKEIINNNSIEYINAITDSGNEVVTGEVAKVASLEVTSILTGTESFDAETVTDSVNEDGTVAWTAGNDISENDDVVRSNDSITYNLLANLEIKDLYSNIKNLSGGRLYFKISIPENQYENAQIFIDSLSWATYKKESNQKRVVEGYYDLPTSSISIPGQISISFKVGTFGVENGSVISPSIDVWLEGNTNDEKISYKSKPIYISSRANFNVRIVDGERTRWDYQDLDGDGEKETLGKIFNLQYAVFYSNSSDEEEADSAKVLKGLKNSTGDFNFDINMSMIKTIAETGEQEDITDRVTPILISYNHNSADKIVDKNGHLYNKNYSNYTPGTQNIIYDNNKISVNISGYKFTETYYVEREGCPFAIGEENLILDEGNIEVFVPYDNELMENKTYNFYFNSEISDFYIDSYNENVMQVYNKDNEVTSQYVVVKGNDFNQTFGYSKIGNTVNFTTYNEGDVNVLEKYNSYYLGSSFILGIDNFNNVKSASKLIKFDGDYFEIDTSSDKFIKNKFDGTMEFEMYYVTKKNGINWIDQTEMNETTIDELNIYYNYSDIPKDYICVGVYFESTEGELFPGSDGEEWLAVPVSIKKDSEYGKYFTMTGYTKVWLTDIDREKYNILDEKEQDYPSPDWESGYRYYTPYDNHYQYIIKNYTNNLDYDKSYGPNNGMYYYGRTFLIEKNRYVEGKAYKYNSESVEENRKIVLDYANNEYRLDYSVSLISNTYHGGLEDYVDYNVEIELPEGVSYIEGSCSEQSKYYVGEPEIIKDSSGITYLRWNNIQVPKELFDETENSNYYRYKVDNYFEISIEFDPTIKNGTEKFIYSHDYIVNPNSKTGGAITIINLQQYSLYKKATTSLIEKNGDIHYRIYFTNNTNLKLSDFQMLDILPYNSDPKGSKFSGSYVIDNISIEQKNSTGDIIDNSNLELRVSDNNQVLSLSCNSDKLKDDNIWNKVIENNKKYNINSEQKALNLTGEIVENGQIIMDVHLKTNGNKSSDIYYNNVTCQTLKNINQIESVNVKTEVINRTLSGIAWIDRDKDGMIDFDGTEQNKEGIKMTLLDSCGNKAIDSDGNIVESVYTDNNGYYEFKNLNKEEFVVQAEYDNTRYYLTKPEILDNSNYSSKFYDEEKIGIGKTNIITTLNGSGYSHQDQKNVNIGLVEYEGNIIVNHIDKNNGTILETEYITQPLDTSVKTSSKNFDDYILVEKPEVENYIILKDEQVVNYYYSLQGQLIINKVDYKGDKIISDSAKFEILDKKNNKIYFNKIMGINIHFASDFKFENPNYDWIEIYYIINGVTYRYEDNGNYKFSNLDLANKTISIPSNEFYIWIRTDGSGVHRGYEIDNITYERLKVIRNDPQVSLPTDVKETLEYSGNNYPKSNESNSVYSNNMRTLYHYKGNSNEYSYESGAESVDFVETTNGSLKIYLPVGEYIIKEIEAPDGYVLSSQKIVLEVKDNNILETNIKNDKDTSVIVKHVTEDGVDLVEPETIEGKVGDTYNTEEKEFDDYEIKIIPENADGVMEEEQIEVIYVYSQIKGKVTITKVDKDDTSKLLEGAIYKIEKLDKDGNIDSTFKAQEKTTGKDGQVEFVDLTVGKYKVTEIKAPEGYELSKNNIDVEITKEQRDINLTATNILKLTLPKTGSINYAIVISTIGLVIMISGIIIKKKFLYK